jgi:hypothetical protein
MEKSGLYNRPSIMLSKSKKSIDKNASRAVRLNQNIISVGQRASRRGIISQKEG